MNRRGLLLLAILSLPLLLAMLLFSLPANANPRPVPLSPAIDPDLQEALAADPDTHQRFIVYLAKRARLRLAQLPSAADARRTAVVNQLQETARASQAGLLDLLDALESRGQVKSREPLWIVNAVVVEGTSEALAQLAQRPEVARIALDETVQYLPPTEELRPFAPTQPIEWGVTHVRAPYVWEGLGVDGAGVTVAIIDTGADWRHPALQSSYRGAGGDHHGNWFDAVDGTERPVDPNGHGTHVAGTVTGQGGIGVAPGAHWIGVRIFDAYGSSSLSIIHQGFQWLLAPEGDPRLAPDVVNGSWGGPGSVKEFAADVAALHAAGIITVFSAGNEGPWAATIHAPASYTDTIAVGASDLRDQVTWFSGRGPSPVTARAKPLLIAPGAHIYSAIPGERYGRATGTSMATPHVAGAVALLLSAEPTLSPDDVAYALTTTARPLSTTVPNERSGWGLVDAYAAVAPHTDAGRLEGIVRADGAPLAAVPLLIQGPGGDALQFGTDEKGEFAILLQPGRYDLVVSPFGYQALHLEEITLLPGQTASRQLELTRLPHGRFQGEVRSAGDGTALPARVEILPSPVSTTADAQGTFSLSLPAGRYTARIGLNGYRSLRREIVVEAGKQTEEAFALATAPSILLVDAAPWFFMSEAEYYRSSLDALDYSYDEWPIYNPYTDIPTADELEPYDTVIWTQPYLGPSYLGAQFSLVAYLEGGGNLLISGQNIGAVDGDKNNWQFWWQRQLQANFEGEADSPFLIDGLPGTPFSGLSLALNGADSANNQIDPDIVVPKEDSLTEPILAYDNEQIAGLGAGWCEEFHIAYLGFGLEGVADGDNRRALLQSSFDFFAAPPVEAGLQVLPGEVDKFVLPGDALTYTFQLRNLSEHLTDTVSLETEGAWGGDLSGSQVTLGPCASTVLTLTIDVPAAAPLDSLTPATVTARSANSGLQAQAVVRHKTPGRILLVGDERWYSQEAIYRQALEQSTDAYDLWDTDIHGSPPEAMLNAYDIVLWYTGYDWYQPVTKEEIEALTGYLEQGGRLFLSGQDYLLFHGTTRLTREFLGVLDYVESITPTVAFGGSGALFGEPAGPFRLNYPFRNFSDGLVPATGSEPFLWHNKGMAAGIATAGPGWRTIFWGIPFEALPSEIRGHAVNQVLGWLGNLGDSSFVVSRPGATAATRAYTLTIAGVAGAEEEHVSVTNTLPATLHIDPATLVGGRYNPASREVTWQGSVGDGERHVIRYQSSLDGDLAAGTRVDNEVILHTGPGDPPWHRTASTWVEAPDLRPSTLQARPDQIRLPHETATYVAVIENGGVATAPLVSATLRLPPVISPVTDSLHSSDGRALLDDRGVRWAGSLAPGGRITVSVAITAPLEAAYRWVTAALYVEDGITAPIVRPTRLYLTRYDYYFPFVPMREQP